MEFTKELSLGELLREQSIKGKNMNRSLFKNAESSEIMNKKRANKNRPREQSSKIPVQRTFPITKTRKYIRSRDPRFDSFCGTFNEHFFRDSYSFLDDIKKKEKSELELSLKKEQDPSRKKQIQFLLKRMTDQERENDRKNVKVQKKIEQREKLKKKLLEGKSAHFQTKSEKKLSELVDKYEELKSKGRVQKYLKKKQKKEKKVPF